MSTGGPRVRAAHWLLDAPWGLRAQSHRMQHGAGLGWFSLGGEPVRDRAPLAAFENADFDLHARNVPSHTFVSHVRDASVGGLTVHNCHPFVMSDRLFAHNGVVKGLDVLRTWMTDVDRAHVAGETDSELVFAYVTAEIRRRGDTTAGIVEAVRRIAAELPVFSLNLLVAEAGRMWALRYPESNELWVLSPGEGGLSGPGRAAGTDGPVPAVVIASEPMDEQPGWRPLQPGELLTVDGLTETSLFPFGPLRHPLRRSDLSIREAASQATAPDATGPPVAPGTRALTDASAALSTATVSGVSDASGAASPAQASSTASSSGASMASSAAPSAPSSAPSPVAPSVVSSAAVGAGLAVPGAMPRPGVPPAGFPSAPAEPSRPVGSADGTLSGAARARGVASEAVLSGAAVSSGAGRVRAVASGAIPSGGLA